MYSFGKLPPRNLDSFGISGLLGEGAKVFFSSLFSTHQIGRVSDLLSARLRSTKTDELRFRALLLFSAFEADRVKSREGLAAGVTGFGEPLILECGVDPEKLAIGAAFTVEARFKLEPEGLNRRLDEGLGKGPFEALLAEMKSHSDRIVIRFQPSSRRLEIVALLALPGKMDEIQLRGKAPAEIRELGADVPLQGDPGADYQELGDLDYMSLLKEDAPSDKLAPPPTGKILAGDPAEGEALFKVKGQAEEKELVRKVTETGAEEESETIAERQASPDPQAIEEAVEARVSVYKIQISELQRKLEELQAEKRKNLSAAFQAASEAEQASSGPQVPLEARVQAQSQPSADEDPSGEQPQAEENESSIGQVLRKNLRKIWPFKNKTRDFAPEEAALQEIPLSENQERKPDGKPSESTEQAAVNLQNEISNGDLAQTLEKAQKELQDIKKEVKSAKANRWMDGLMNELLLEKSRLNESAKKMHLAVRQKEYEFRAREQSVREELRKSQEALRQKESALVRAKEQVAHLTIMAGKSSQQGAGDEGFKKKFIAMQNLFSAEKGENAQLLSKIDDLKSQLMTAQMNSSQNRGSADGELSSMRQRLERSNRQSEEYKRLNQQLMEKLNERMRKDRSTGSGAVDELKKRLDAAMKTGLSAQKEVESLKLRLDETHRERARIQRELDEARGNPQRNSGNTDNAA